MKLEGERRKRFHGDEMYQRGFQNIGNRVKPPLRTQICFIAPVFFFAGLLLHRRGAGHQQESSTTGSVDGREGSVAGEAICSCPS